MGYELVYHYREEISRGEYDSEVKTRSVKIGHPYDDITLETVAGKIFRELARRDIFVCDVEIFEFAKKQISFRENKDGIVIKNKKFSFDDGTISSAGEDESGSGDTDLLAKLLANPAIVAALQNNNPQVAQHTPTPPPLPKKDVIIRHEVFDPDKVFLEEVRAKGVKMTVGKQYGIYGETPTTWGGRPAINYLIEDDDGHRRTVLGNCFVPVQRGLIGNFIDDRQEINSVELAYPGMVKEESYNLRR